MPSVLRRSAGLALLATAGCALAAAVPAAAAGGHGKLQDVCGRGAHHGELVTSTGSKATCANGVKVMRAWRRAGDPRSFRSLSCGEVGPTVIRFHRDKRYFATWQCSAPHVRYRIWTRY